MIFNNDLSPDRLYAILISSVIPPFLGSMFLSVSYYSLFLLAITSGLVVLLWKGYKLGRYLVLLLIGLGAVGATLAARELLLYDRNGDDLWLAGAVTLYAWVGGVCLVGLLFHRVPQGVVYPWWRVDTYPALPLVGVPVLGFGAILLTQLMLQELKHETLMEAFTSYRWKEWLLLAELLLIFLSGLLMVLGQEVGRWGMVAVLVVGWLLLVILGLVDIELIAIDWYDLFERTLGLLGVAIFCAAVVLQLFNTRAMAKSPQQSSSNRSESVADDVLDNELF